MPFCTACGKQNPDDARFCAQCGTKLLAGEDTGASPVETTATITFGAPDQRRVLRPPAQPRRRRRGGRAPEGHALLVVQRGPSAGSRFLLDVDVVGAGRHPDSEIFLDDVTVSRRHAEFRRTGTGYDVSDVGSLNGTYVNRDRIDSVELNDGDEVQIGKYRLVFFSSHPDS